MKNFPGTFGSLTLLSLLVASASVQAAAIESTFDAGLEGWTSSEGGELAFEATGGNPGGFLKQTDTSLNDMFVNAPAKFLGNLTPYLNGTLSFDARQVSGDGEKYAPFGFVTIFNGGNAVSVDIAGANAPSTDWTTFSVKLDADGFETTLEALTAVLSNVTMISVELESQIGIVEATGMDNFRITSAVPEPSTLMIAGLGVCGVLSLVHRRNV